MIRALIVLAMLLSSSIAAAQSITLSPAVVPLGGRAGQSTSQRLSLFNGTSRAMTFTVSAKDVVIREGRRVFVAAGELRGSVAATAAFSSSTLQVGPGEERSIEVTVTLPAQMTNRAVVILFQSTTRIGVNATASLGTLLTFELSGKVSVAPGELQVVAPSASTNAVFRLPVANDGTEPAIVRGAAVVLDERGALVAKVALPQRRLLPGERTALETEFAGALASGHYRVVATIDGAQRAWTRTTELTVP